MSCLSGIAWSGDVSDNTQQQIRAREVADGLKIAIRELAKDEPETLRAFLMAVWEHTADGASKWVGRKLFALLAGALFTLALWLISLKGFGGDK